MKTFQQTCKIINTKKIKIFGALFMMLFTQSCIKEEYDKVEHKTNYYYLTATQLNQTPYFTNPNFDTISFASDKGDTLTFVKTKTDTTWYCENGSGNPNTGYDKDCYQTIHNTYATVKGNGSFDVKHSLQDAGQSYDLIKILIRANGFAIKDYWIGDKAFSTFIDTITIRNKVYYECLRNTISSNNQNVSFCYINRKYGLFYFEEFKNNTQYLIIK